MARAWRSAMITIALLATVMGKARAADRVAKLVATENQMTRIQAQRATCAARVKAALAVKPDIMKKANMKMLALKADAAKVVALKVAKARPAKVAKLPAAKAVVVIAKSVLAVDRRNVADQPWQAAQDVAHRWQIVVTIGADRRRWLAIGTAATVVG